MKHISRNIWKYYDYRHGYLFVFRVRGKEVGKFLTLEMAEEARQDYDFEKKSWTAYTKENITEIPDDVEEIKSKVILHQPTGMWYVKMMYNDDIIVSDLYRFKSDAQDVKDYLDKNRWSVRALNHQKKTKTTCSRDYAGILPLKNGYLVVDVNKIEHGLFKTIDEAKAHRDKLRKTGVVI